MHADMNMLNVRVQQMGQGRLLSRSCGCRLLPLYTPAVCIYLSVEPSNTIAEHLTTTEAQNQPKAHENDVSSKTRRRASYSNSKTVKSDQIRSKKRTNTPLCRPPLRRDPREG